MKKSKELITSNNDCNNNLGKDNENMNDEKLKDVDLIIEEGLLINELCTDPFTFYEKVSVLGEGAFGKVIKVRHKTSNVYRAMKIIQKEKAKFAKQVEDDLIKEITILKSLDHPNIMKVYDYYNTPENLYIVSELCTGGELHDKLTQENHFTEEVSCYIMKQLLSAVDFCHNYSIIHRDLKPENILIESEEESKKNFFIIKVIDFGTSDKMKKGKMIKEQIGTALYIAPEVIKASYNEKCDLWSCGVIMYTLLSGKTPFKGEDEHEIYENINIGKFYFDDEIWDTISEDAKQLIKQLLTKDISKRISAKEALEHSWIKNFRKNENFNRYFSNILNRDEILKLVKNISNYSATHKIKQASLAYIVHNLIKKEDTECLRNIFVLFDTNGDGRLTEIELMNGFNLVLSQEESTKEAHRVMKFIDVNGNGLIEYEEFLRAGLDKDKILTKENLEIAFKMFDIHKRNKFNKEELKCVLGKNRDDLKDEFWNNLISTVDLNKDGDVSFDEFTTLMEGKD